MNDFTQNQVVRRDETRRQAPTTVADVTGVIWTHSNPAELYRWITRRNALLSTIDVAFARQLEDKAHPQAGKLHDADRISSVPCRRVG